ATPPVGAGVGPSPGITGSRRVSPLSDGKVDRAAGAWEGSTASLFGSFEGNFAASSLGAFAVEGSFSLSDTNWSPLLRFQKSPIGLVHQVLVLLVEMMIIS